MINMLKPSILALTFCSAFSHASSTVDLQQNVLDSFLNNPQVISAIEALHANPTDELTRQNANAVIQAKLYDVSLQFNIPVDQVDAIVMHDTSALYPSAKKHSPHYNAFSVPDEHITILCDDNCSSAANSGSFGGWAETAASMNNVGYGAYFNVGYLRWQCTSILPYNKNAKVFAKNEGYYF